MDDSGDLVYGLVATLLFLIPAWRIFQRTGLGGPWALLVVVPLVGPLTALLILAFASWPNARPEPSSHGEI